MLSGFNNGTKKRPRKPAIVVRWCPAKFVSQRLRSVALTNIINHQIYHEYTRYIYIYRDSYISINIAWWLYKPTNLTITANLRSLTWSHCTFFGNFCGGYCVTEVPLHKYLIILWMQEILHQARDGLSVYPWFLGSQPSLKPVVSGFRNNAQ